MQTLKNEKKKCNNLNRCRGKSKFLYSPSKEGQLKFMKNWFKEMFWLLNRTENYVVINRSSNSFFYGNETLTPATAIPIVGIMPFDNDVFDVYAVDEESKSAFETMYQLIS